MPCTHYAAHKITHTCSAAADIFMRTFLGLSSAETAADVCPSLSLCSVVIAAMLHTAAPHPSASAATCMDTARMTAPTPASAAAEYTTALMASAALFSVACAACLATSLATAPASVAARVVCWATTTATVKPTGTVLW
jgi:hypothetical protein